MDIDSQVEEFDSSSSESSSSEDEDDPPRGDGRETSDALDEEEDIEDRELKPGRCPLKGGLKKRKRVRHAPGLRKKLRTHYESVEDFNPEARSAQSAELERIRRLELQHTVHPSANTIHSTHPHTAHSLARLQTSGYEVTTALKQNTPHHALSAESEEIVKHEDGDNPELVSVDLTHLTRQDNSNEPPMNMIVIDSGSDSDASSEKERYFPPPSAVGQQSVKLESSAPPPSGYARQDHLHRGYDDPTVPRPDGRLVVNAGHTPSEQDVFLAPQLARIIKPHQV